MVARVFKDRADWVSVIVEGSERALAENPGDKLIRYTTLNPSGGHDYWGQAAWSVYRAPESLEEGLLALELRSVLERAVSNQLADLDTALQAGEVSLDLFGFPMDFGMCMSTAEKLAVRNPLAGLQYKVRASQMARRASGLSLLSFLSQYCFSGRIPDVEICDQL